jgi:hypothetical protein
MTMATAARNRVAVVVWCLVAALVPTPSHAIDDALIDPPPLAARLSSADAAMEYWDVTAWLDSGMRVAARFLVTNQGPGDRTAAAVGHVVLADGRTLPFHWGRRGDAWTLGADGRRLEIGRAALDLSGPTLVLIVTSKKRGIDLRLEIARSTGVSRNETLDMPYGFEIVLPTTARGRIGSTEVSGAGALTHTWMDRAEGDLLRRRDEVFARGGDTAIYSSTLTLADDQQRQLLVVDRKNGGGSHGAKTIVEYSGPLLGSDPSYPVHSTWTVDAGPTGLTATLEREWLRMNPLDILPQPFRFLLSLGGKPQRIWADARVTLERSGTELRGVAVSTFARPVER